MASHHDNSSHAPLRGAERRSDAATAEKIDMALLTRRAFDTRTARTFCRLSGIGEPLAEQVLARSTDQVRRTNTVLQPADRRHRGRDEPYGSN